MGKTLSECSIGELLKEWKIVTSRNPNLELSLVLEDVNYRRELEKELLEKGYWKETPNAHLV